MPKRTKIFILSSITVAAVLAGAWYGFGLDPEPPASLSENQGRRYAEIHRLIRKNLHFSAHMTWSVNVNTIGEARKHVGVADIPVLVAMLGDERAAVGFGAGSLLATLGDPALPALRRAQKSRDYSVSSRASDALGTIKRCRDGKSRMSPKVCPSPPDSGG